MSSKKPYNWDVAAAKQKNVELPNRFVCRDCKKMKPPHQYSNNELKDFRFKKSNNIQVNGVTAQLRCRICTGEQTQELQCTGPCDLWKGLEEFSKNQRRHPENAWCVTCTQWKEAQEPGITPLAAPNSLLSPDEEVTIADEESSFEPYFRGDIEGEADSDEEYENNSMYNSMTSLSLGGGMARNVISGSRGGQSGISNPRSVHGTVPSYLTKPADKPIVKSESSVSNPYEDRTDHGSDRTGLLLEGLSDTRSTTNTVINSLRGDEKPLASGPGVSTLKAKKQGPATAYNAWDNSGQAHTQYRAKSLSTGPAGSAGLGSSSGVIMGPSKPSLGWAKHPSTRVPPINFPALSRPIQQNNYEDDEDSPDEM